MKPITKDGKTLLGYADGKQLAKLGLTAGGTPPKGSKIRLFDEAKAQKQLAAEKEAAAAEAAKEATAKAGEGAQPAAVKKSPAKK